MVSNQTSATQYESQSPFLFVYGTLLPQSNGALGISQRLRLRSEGTFLGNAQTDGVLLDLGGYPGLIDGSTLVHGGIYRLRSPEASLPWLDAYETGLRRRLCECSTTELHRREKRLARRRAGRVAKFVRSPPFHEPAASCLRCWRPPFDPFRRLGGLTKT